MGPVIMYRDNMSCMAMLARGRSSAERSRHIAIRYFWTKKRVDNGEMRIVYKGSKEMYARSLQGSQFIYERECLTRWTADKTVKTVAWLPYRSIALWGHSSSLESKVVKFSSHHSVFNCLH
jgi:hypothetical protein